MRQRGLGRIALAVMALAGGMAWAAENKAVCPVSGKPMTVGEKTPRVRVNGQPLYFCSDKCPAAFAKTPEKFVKSPPACRVVGSPALLDAGMRLVVNHDLFYFCCPGCPEELLKDVEQHVGKTRDVVTGKEFAATANSPHLEHQGQHYYFASEESKAAFVKEPGKYAVVYGK